MKWGARVTWGATALYGASLLGHHKVQRLNCLLPWALMWIVADDGDGKVTWQVNKAMKGWQHCWKRRPPAKEGARRH